MRNDKNSYKSIMVISDLHSPYMHPDTYEFLEAMKAKYKPDCVVLTGDEVDHAAISFHETDPELPNAAKELELAIGLLEPIYKMFPKAYVLESNHGSLVFRRAKAHGLPLKVFRSYNEILDAPKTWEWVPNIILNTSLGPVFFTHGISSSPGKLASSYGLSAVQGHHHHTAHIKYISTPERLLFDMIVGCMIDDKSRAFAYNKLIPNRPIISCAVIVNGIPHLIPMVLDKTGRWVGAL